MAKSNQGGIETACALGIRANGRGQNRTKVGLKPLFHIPLELLLIGQNRTKVGLKPVLTDNFVLRAGSGKIEPRWD